MSNLSPGLFTAKHPQCRTIVLNRSFPSVERLSPIVHSPQCRTIVLNRSRPCPSAPISSKNQLTFQTPDQDQHDNQQSFSARLNSHFVSSDLPDSSWPSRACSSRAGKSSFSGLLRAPASPLSNDCPQSFTPLPIRPDFV